MNEAQRRWYSPTFGRWTSNDPILFNGQDINLYRIEANNPSNFTDPTGQKKYSVWITLSDDITTEGAAAWHAVKSNFDELNPFTGTSLTYRAKSLPAAVDDLRKRLIKDKDACISQLEFVGHGYAGGWFVGDQKKKGLIGGPTTIVLDTATLDKFLKEKANGQLGAVDPNVPIATVLDALNYLRSVMCDVSVAILKQCNEANGAAGDEFCNKLSMTLNKWVQANDGNIEVFGRGQWWEYHLDGDIIKVN